MVTFELFVRPVIRRMLGHTRLHRRPVAVTLAEPVTAGARLTHFMRGDRDCGCGRRAERAAHRAAGVGDPHEHDAANALLIVPEGRERVEAGETLNALLLTEEGSLAEHFAL